MPGTFYSTIFGFNIGLVLSLFLRYNGAKMMISEEISKTEKLSKGVCTKREKFSLLELELLELLQHECSRHVDIELSYLKHEVE